MNDNSRRKANQIFSSLGFKLWLPSVFGVVFTLMVIWVVVAMLGPAEHLWPVAIIATVLAVTANIVAGWFIRRHLLRSLQELRDGAARLASGQLAHRISIHTGDEVEMLACEFNDMAENLQRSQQQLAAFAQDKIRQAEEAQARLRELSLVAENSRTISASLDLDTTLNAILASVREAVPYDLAEICLWQPEAGLLRTRAQGADPKYAAHRRSPSVYTLEEGLTGWLARHGESLLIDDVRKETSVKPKLDPKEFPIRAYVGVPLMIGEELVGTLELASYMPGAFTQANVTTLQTVAAQAAVAIQNARLFQETRRRAEEMTALRDAAIETARYLDQEHVLRSVVERAARLLHGQGGAVYKVDAEKQSLSLLVSYQLRPDLTRTSLQFGEGVSGQVAQKRQPVIINDYSHWEGRVTLDKRVPYSAVIGVPLIWQDELVGVINVLADAEQHRFDDDDLRLLTLFASQAAVALQTSNLYQQLVRRVEETSALRETAMDIVSELDPDRLLETIVRRAVALLHAKGGSLHRYNSGNGSSRLMVSYNMGRDYRGVVMSRGEDLAGYVLETSQPLVVSDYRAWAGRSPQFAECNFSAVMGVPLTWQDQKLGALVVFADAAERAFDLGDVRMLTMFAAQAAISLQNADLYQETRRRLAELATLTDVGRAISSTLDVPHLLDVVAEQTARVMYADKLYLAVYHPASDEIEFVLDTRPDMPRSGRRRHMSNGLTEYVIRTHQPLFLRGDVLRYMSELGIDLIGIPVAAWIGVPLMAGERVLGVLCVQHYTDPDIYDESHVEVLQSIANQVAVALENARLFAEAQRRVTELDTLTDIGRALSSTLNVDELMQVIYQQTQRVMDAHNLYVALYDHLTQETNFAFYMHEGQPRQIPKRSGTRGLTEHVILTGKPLLLRGDVPEQIRALGVEAIGTPSAVWLGVPMIVGQRVVGMISAQHYQDSYAYNEHHLGLLQGIANQAAIALENARLFAETRRRVAELATLTDIGRALSSTLKVDKVLRLVYEQTQRVMHADNMFIALYDDMRDEVEFAFSVNRGEIEPGTRRSAKIGLTGHVIQTRQTLFLRGNVMKFLADQGIEVIGPPAASWLGVPMLIGERVLGALVVQHYDDPAAYDDTHGELLEAIASQAAIALDNARLYQMTDVRLRERVEELTALSSISRELNTTLHMPTIFELVLDGAIRASDAEYASIYLLNAESQELELQAVRGYQVETPPPKQVMGQGVIGRAVTTGQPVVVDDVRQDPHYLPVVPSVRSEMSVPISYAGSVVGAINLESSRAAAFHEEDVSFISALASQAAIAIGNVQRIEEAMQRGELLRHRADQLSNLFEISQAFRSNRPLDNVLEDVAHAIQETVGFDVVVISLVEGDPPVQRHVAAAGVPMSVFEEMKTSHPLWSQIEPLLRDEFRVSQSYYFPAEKREAVAGLSTFDVSRAPAGPRHPGRWHPLDLLLVPLRGSAGQILGVISADDPLDERIPDIPTIETLELFANQSAVAIENNRLYTELEQRVDERTKDLHLALDQLTAEHGRVETLYRVTSELSASLDLDRVLNRALTLVAESIGASRGSILLVDSQTDALIHRAALGRKPPLPPGGMVTPYRRGEGLAGWVIQHQRPVIIKDVRADDRWVPRIDSSTSDYRSALAVPLVSNEDVLGALIMHHPHPEYFTQDHLRLVEAAARQVATAINNAELYRLIREQAERLGSMLRAQQEEASKSQAILEGVADGVMVANAQGRVILFNAAAERILDARRDEIVGRPMEDLLGLYGAVGINWIAQVHRWLVSANARSEVTSVEQRLQFEDRFVDVHVAPVTMGEEYLGTVSVFRDITKEVEVDRAKTEFVSTVSHEMRTPMTSIKGYADLMLLGAAGVMNEDQKRFLSIIKANADRLSGLVNDLLDIGRIEGGRIELDIKPLRLESLVDQVANTLRSRIEEKGLKLSLNLAPDLPMIVGDRDRVIQVLTNLVSNAYQYTKPGGTITVIARRVGDMVQTDVSDTGIGIAPEDQAKVFERFFRADDPNVQEFSGTGLGLAIVKSLIEMLRGRIWLESEVGKGTTFSFTLPISEEEAPVEPLPFAAPKMVTYARKNGGQRHVLVVEDDQNIAQLIGHHLKDGGYEVSTAGSAEDALRVARREQPDLITLDIYLPGTDGFELLQTLKSDEATADIPVVIVSVLADKRQGLRLGAVDYMTKPIDEKLLLDTVGRVLLGVGKVLVVDDDRDTLDLLRQALSSQGFRVRTTASGRRAMQLVREDKPDLILLDLKLPGGVDGYQVLTQLKQSEDTANIPVIVITGSLTAEDVKRQKVLALGASRFLTKPFEIDDLISEIHHFLGESQAVQE